MNAKRGKEFYEHFIDIKENVDPAAQKQRQTYDKNLREIPPSPREKYLKTQNAILRQKIKEYEDRKYTIKSIP